jgi:predicted branched-subunit amino acid permease
MRKRMTTYMSRISWKGLQTASPLLAGLAGVGFAWGLGIKKQAAGVVEAIFYRSSSLPLYELGLCRILLP